MSFAKQKEMKWEGYDPKRKKKVTKSGSRWEGVDNEDMLQQLLAPFVHFRRVEDCIDLPEKQEIPIDLGLPDDRLLKDANIEEPEAYMALLERLARAKTPHMLDWVEDFLQGTQEQLVVFAMYRFPIEELAEKYPKHVRLITGAEKGADRAQNLADFQQGKFRILAMTYKAGSESLNCQNAHKALYHGYPWTDGTLQQAMARIYRSGQQKKTMHYFLTSGENDMRILDLVLSKADATNKVQALLLNEKLITTLDGIL
jgi:superfamily II DNA or RNA helicase